MDYLLLQDWITLKQVPAAGGVVQGADRWLDLSEYEDVIFYVDVSANSTGAGTTRMTYQTSPTREDASFVAVVPQFVVAASATPRVDRVLVATALTPVARWVRWRVDNTDNACDVTFRIRLAAYAIQRKEEPWTPCCCSRG